MKYSFLPRMISPMLHAFASFCLSMRTLGAWLAGTWRPPLHMVGQWNAWEHETDAAVSVTCAELHWRHFPLGNNIQGSPGLFGLSRWEFGPGDAFQSSAPQSGCWAQAAAPHMALLGLQGLNILPAGEEKSGLLALSWHRFHETKAFYSGFIWIHLWKPHFVFP